jgi:hypothetical protein
MGLGSRCPRLLTTVSAAVLLGVSACGGSVADADRPRPTTATALNPFCAAAKDNADALRPLNGFAQRGSVPPDQLQNTVDAVRHSGIALIAAAPSDIRADVQIVVDALDAQLDALVRAKGDIAAVARDPAASATAAATGAAAASQRVSAYITRTCSGQ